MFNFDFSKQVAKKFNQQLTVEDHLISTKDMDRILEKFFRPYQKDMWQAFKDTFDYQKQGEKAWVFSAGTGTGKTEIFKFIAPYIMAKRKEEGNKEGLVFGLICHRLCLIQDLKNRILPIFWNDPDFTDPLKYVASNPSGCGLNKDKIKFYIVNSGAYKTSVKDRDIKEDKDSEIKFRSDVLDSLNIPNAKHVKSMDITLLKQEIEENKKNGIHSMFICLYQSVASYYKKLSELNFDFIIGDECHTLNSMGTSVFSAVKDFTDTVKASYWFTASMQRHPDDISEEMSAAMQSSLAELDKNNIEEIIEN